MDIIRLSADALMRAGEMHGTIGELCTAVDYHVSPMNVLLKHGQALKSDRLADT